ncbi:MAG: transglycosylase domain-containing protein [Anaerolineae bacterium]
MPQMYDPNEETQAIPHVREHQDAFPRLPDYNQLDADVTRRSPQAPPPARRQRRGCFRNCFVLSLMGLAIAIFAGIVSTGTVIYVRFSNDLEEGIAKLDNIDERETFETTRIMDRNGELLWEIFGDGKRTYVTLDKIPLNLQQATISVEDDTFYENVGADLPSLIAALIYNFRNPNERPIGASTITQQLVRHIAFDYEERTAVSYDRKAREIMLAWILNRDYPKEQILEMYLNEIYYGNLAYGIEAAAQTYFKKSAADLTIAESTLLAGLPQAPADLDPINNFEAAKQRQWVVLNLMVSEGYLEADEIAGHYQEPLEFAEQTVSLKAPHFATYVRRQLELQFGSEELANSGLQVTTSLDMEYQELAQALTKHNVDLLRDEHNLNNAALVAMKPGSGEVLAMVGSVDYYDDSIDGKVNVTTSLQQPGSSIKPITYAAAMTPGTNGLPAWQPGDIVWDVETKYQQTNGQSYSPVNYDSRFHGPVRLRAALANSYNIPAVLLLQDIGVPWFLEFASRMGIGSLGNDASRYGLSLTLGAGEVTPLELTSAYAAFANGGQKVTPVTILEVKSSDGEVLYTYTPPAQPEQVLDPRVAFLINDILSDDAARIPAMGRDNPLDLPFPAAAKTGTTNDFRDNWTMGYTPGLVVGVWAGNTDNTPMVNVTGLTGAAPLWNDFMTAVYADIELQAGLEVNSVLPPSAFTVPAGVEQRSICTLASIVPGATECQVGGSEWYITNESETVSQPISLELVNWTEIEPSVVRVPAAALPELSAEVIEAQAAAIATGAVEDEDALPRMQMCHFAEGTVIQELPPGTTDQIFLMPPRNLQSLKAAYEWAFANGVAILPTDFCTEEMMALVDPNGAIQVITSPKPNEVVSGIWPIMGTADFDMARAQFFKMELGVPQADSSIQWVTLGDTHSQPVRNGQLEVLYSEGLTPGTYYLRVIVINRDGNYAGEPTAVPFVIEG